MYTSQALTTLVEMTLSVNVGSAAPSFSYHAILLSSRDAETRSMSPSPSMSAAAMSDAPSASRLMTRSSKLGSSAPSLRYQAIWFERPAVATSSNSSSSSFAATAEIAPLALK